MTKNDIVLEITKDKAYIDYCKKVCSGKDIYKDLFQYAVLYLLEMEEKKLLDIYSRGTMKYYFIRIIYINFNSTNSPFFRIFNGHTPLEELTRSCFQVPETSEENSIDELLIKFDDEMDRECNACIQKGIYPASVMLYHLYEKTGSYTEVAKCTKIPYKTVQRHVHSIRDKVVKKIK